jgi:membrane protein implicated in regulation of membrane protease activity
VGIALPDAEVAILGCGGEASEMVEGSSCLLEVGRVIFGNIDVSFRLGWLGGVGDEAQPGVGGKFGWAEIDQLLPWDLGLDDPICCGHVIAVLKCHVRQARACTRRAADSNSAGTARLLTPLRRGTFEVSALDGEAAFMPWIAWLIVAVALGVAEFFTLTLAFGLLAAAALVAAIVAGLGGSVLAQFLAFAISGGVGLLIVRPIARRQMSHPSPVREGSYALIGKKAVVIEEVTGTQGLIKLAGEVWSARALDEDHVIPTGSLVDVMEIEGATAIVYPRELLP